MITVEHGYIRFSEADDTLFLRGLYLEKPRRAALLDTRREPILPTVRDICDMLAKKDAAHGLMYTIEDTTGTLKGWCSLRGINYEARYAEVMFIFASAEDYDSALAEETLAYLLNRAFTHYKLYKVLVLCLDAETALKRFLERHGFNHAGVQRQSLYSGGAWHDLHVFTLSAQAYNDRKINITAGANVS